MKLSDYLKELNEGTTIDVVGNLGYVIAPNCIRRCLRLSQEEKLLLLEIFSHYNEDKHYAYPTQQTLAMYLGVSSASVSKHLKKLEAKGFITSRGRKGVKKRYFPSFNLNRNPYLVLSELFHFATKVISKKFPDSVSGEWGNNLLQFVNVRNKEEFTKTDTYGKYLRLLDADSLGDEALRYDFLNEITSYLEKVTGVQLKINWEEEVRDRKIRLEKKNKVYQKQRTQNKRSKKLELPYDPEYDADIDDLWNQKL